MDWNIEITFAAFVEANKDANTALRGKGSMKALKNAFELHRKVRNEERGQLRYMLGEYTDAKFVIQHLNRSNDV